MNCTECKDFFCKHRSQSTAGGECFYESKEQMEKLSAITAEATLDYIDWSAFRREAAKDAMTGMMANADFWQQVWSHNRVNGRCDYPSEIAHFAIACADELIKQLKEEKK